MSRTIAASVGTVAALVGTVAVMTAIAAVAGLQPAPPPGVAYAVIDLRTNRVIREARPDVLATPMAPGSVIKIATLIAALEQGVIDSGTRVACRHTIIVDGRTLTCTHPDLHRPMGPAEALGFSCNTYFASIAPRVSRPSLDGVLVRMGLSPIGPDASAALRAIGLAGIRETPRALLNAFVRVASPDSGFRMSAGTRDVVMQGLRLAATQGTASAFGEAGVAALAKTGTAPMNGGGYYGIVVATIPEIHPDHALVVVAPGGAGRDAAAIAVDVLRDAGLVRKANKAEFAPTPAPVQAAARANAGGSPAGSTNIRLGVARRGGGFDIESIPFERYVSRVVAGEMPAGAPRTALEVLAITARTYAVVNLHRHDAEGFDLCDLTHCQVLGRSTIETDRAAHDTEGLVLRDGAKPATVFFSSSCGGHTELPSSVWAGAHDPAHLPARRDTACAGEPSWTSELAQPQLRRVLLAAGLRGAMVRSFGVATRDASGRAAVLSVDGMVPDRLDANVFARASGQVLGWQVIKSTLFDVRRSAVGYLFAGRGLGHGVGLCVRGAINRSTQGRSRDEILEAYFPGLSVGPIGPTRLDVRVLLPEADRQNLDEIRALTSRSELAMSAKLGIPAAASVELRFHPTVEAYTRATGSPWWTSARTRAPRVDLQPLDALRKRGTLELTIRHELVHVLTDSVLTGRPLWIREGLAIVMAGELEARGATAVRVTCPSDAELRDARSSDAWRRAYLAAGQCVARALSSGTRWQDLR